MKALPNDIERVRSLIYGVRVARSDSAAQELSDLLDELDDGSIRIVQASEAMEADVIDILTPEVVKAEWAILGEQDT